MLMMSVRCPHCSRSMRIGVAVQAEAPAQTSDPEAAERKRIDEEWRTKNSAEAAKHLPADWRKG